jgi:hypothetical protein
MKPNGEKVDIIFEAKKITFIDSLGKSTTQDYSQNLVRIENSIKTYGIVLENGPELLINFPISGNESVAFIKNNSNTIYYSMSRTDYILPQDLWKKAK